MRAVRLFGLRRSVVFGAIISLGGITASSFSLPEPQAAAPVLAETRVAQGRLRGTTGRNASITVFKGIPYAAPPVGDLRWRAPQPPGAWDGVRAADQFSASCVQLIVEVNMPWTQEFRTRNPIGEDCLYLNVWTPARQASERRPVYVYIYGGGNVVGSGMVPVYDGEGLASKGLVVVTFNHRLGAFGYLGHPELTQESPYRASGNYGLLDQIAAIRWVRENIAAFGGDPDRITVAGQSAGAGAVHNLTVSPLAAGLFHRTIAQSGSSLNTLRGSRRTLATLEADGVRFASAKGASSLAALRALPWQAIFESAPGQSFQWGPVTDGYALTATTGATFAAGQQHDVPMLTGANADEYGASPQPTATVESFTAQTRERYGESADAFLALYPAATDAEAKASQNASARDTARSSMYLWAIARARTARTPVYTYYFTRPIPGPDVATYGAFHTGEVPYLMNNLSQSWRPFTAVDHRIADTFSTYIVNFATSGDPNGGGLPRWDAVSPDAQTTMEIGERVGMMPVAGSPTKFRLIRANLLR